MTQRRMRDDRYPMWIGFQDQALENENIDRSQADESRYTSAHDRAEELTAHSVTSEEVIGPESSARAGTIALEDTTEEWGKEVKNWAKPRRVAEESDGSVEPAETADEENEEIAGTIALEDVRQRRIREGRSWYTQRRGFTRPVVSAGALAAENSARTVTIALEDLGHERIPEDWYTHRRVSQRSEPARSVSGEASEGKSGDISGRGGNTTPGERPPHYATSREVSRETLESVTEIDTPLASSEARTDEANVDVAMETGSIKLDNAPDVGNQPSLKSDQSLSLLEERVQELVSGHHSAKEKLHIMDIMTKQLNKSLADINSYSIDILSSWDPLLLKLADIEKRKERLMRKIDMMSKLMERYDEDMTQVHSAYKKAHDYYPSSGY